MPTRWVRTDRNGLSSALLAERTVRLTVSRCTVSHDGSGTPEVSERLVVESRKPQPRRPIQQRHDLPDPLFITHWGRLESAIGRKAAAAVRERLYSSRVATPDLDEVRSLLRELPSIRGVAFVRGPSVVPPRLLDTLPVRARRYADEKEICDLNDDFSVRPDDD